MTAPLHWRFDNTYTKLPQAFYSRLNPTAVRDPKLIIFNDQLAQNLGLLQSSSGAISVSGPESAELAALFAGNQVPAGAQPLAQAYAGHQFGGFSMLGDGRAIVLGEHLAPNGKRFDIQLKGSGPTPFSRRGDGRAALGPMLREYIISEAMHALGIATTRSLAVVSTGEPVFRQTTLPGAVLTRVASSHLRVGTFQYAAAKEDLPGLKALVDYAIERHYPQLVGSDVPARALLRQVIDVQASLTVQWMRVGFIHGVMNTDNVTISGETIDYGPCAFMDSYDPATVFSSIDHDGRYSFGNQPGICQWNLLRLAEALLPLLHEDEKQAIEIAKADIGQFAELYQSQWLAMMRDKLGLAHLDEHEVCDRELIEAWLSWMHSNKADYTNSFSALVARLDPTQLSVRPLAKDDQFLQWEQRWRSRLARQPLNLSESIERMRASNPVYIPRNHHVESALTAASEGDIGLFQALLTVVQKPYVQRPGLEAYESPSQRDTAYQTFCGT